MGTLMKGLSYFQGDKDVAMEPYYDMIGGRQSMHARLQTLVNIVAGVAKSKASEPAFAKINEIDCGGMVEGRWKPDGDRDNRGKVYLYFCPEDMTVALDNMRGIGWQGVPDYIHGSQCKYQVEHVVGSGMGPELPRQYRWAAASATRKPLAELGENFRQRVFTAKLRPVPGTQKRGLVLVGQPPHDFALRLEGEDDHAHVAASARSLRESLPIARSSIDPSAAPEKQRDGFRKINGEPLGSPCEADLRGNQIEADKIPASSVMAKPENRGPCEPIDPIDAAIALTGAGGLNVSIEELPDAVGKAGLGEKPGKLHEPERARIEDAYNEAKHPGSKNPEDKYSILLARRRDDGTVVAQVRESPNAARLRWQMELSAKSFHSAIFASHKNHQFVTAYDVAIGSGKASSDPKFYGYLCAVADWRRKMLLPGDKPRHGMKTWEDFLKEFGGYYACEPDERKNLIKGNARYYSSGELPTSLPLLTGKLWDIVIAETTQGARVNKPDSPKRKS